MADPETTVEERDPWDTTETDAEYETRIGALAQTRYDEARAAGKSTTLARERGKIILAEERAKAKAREKDPKRFEKAKAYAAEIEAHKASAKKRSRISVQNLLLRNMDMFSSAHKGVKYKRLTRLHTKTPAAILNKVYRKKKIQPFLDIKPHQVAALVPKIKLYLVHTSDGPGKKSVTIPLKFRDTTTPLTVGDITNTKYGRGDGVGIKSFSVETQGTNPAEGGLVKCTLSVFFQNIEMLAHQQDSEVPSSHDYIELILRRTKYPKKVKDSKDKVVPHARIRNRYGFRLMAVVGWQVPPRGIGTDLTKALRQCKQTIYLNLVDHTIDFKQDGTALLTCEYQGALEQILSGDHYDVLAVSETDTLVEQIDKLQEEIDNFRKKGEDLKEEGDGSKQVKALQKKIVALKQQQNKITKELRTRRYAQILNRLYVSTPPRIGTIDLTPAQVEAIKTGAPLTGVAGVITDDALTPKDTDAKAKEATSKRGEKMGTTRKFRADDEDVSWFRDLFTPKPPEATRASFMYFGDLIDIATEVIEKNHQLDKGSSPNARILLGPVSYNHKLPDGTIQKKQVNLADVPVSLKSFEYWFNKNAAKQKRDSWPLRGFLKSAVAELVLNALGEHSPADEGLRRNNMVGIHSFLVHTKGGAPAIQGSDYNLDDGTFTLGDAEKDKMEAMTPYILVYGSIESPDQRDPGRPDIDISEGVYHFNLGSDRGLLKTATFKKTDVRGLREARFTTQDAEEAQLRDKYDVSIDLIGSSFLFTPGQKLYINPTLTGLGNPKGLKSTARMLGLGGYYDVIKVLSTYDRERGYTTNLSCTWTSFGKTRHEKTSDDAGLGLSPTDPKKKIRSIASPASADPPPDPKSVDSPPVKTPAVPVESDMSERLTKKEEKEKVEKAAKAPEEAPTPVATREELAPTPRPATEAETATHRKVLEDDLARAQENFDKKPSSIFRNRLINRKRNLEEFKRDVKRGSVKAIVKKDGTVRILK